MAGGKLYRVKGKKPVLSNKQLTRRIRRLDNSQGELKTTVEQLYNTVTLTANVADINYCTNLANQNLDGRYHYSDMLLSIEAAGDSFTRCIFFRDWYPNDADLSAGEILNSGTDYSSGYVADVVFGSIKPNHKNWDEPRRVEILWDKLFSHSTTGSSDRVAFQKRFKWYGLRPAERCRIGMLIISTAANIVECSISTIYTNDAVA